MRPPTYERRIALPWLARLRWIAVVGQISATAIGVWRLDLQLPLALIGLVIGLTALTNIAIQVWMHLADPPDWIIPAVLLLDVCMFTLLMYFTGGTENPFIVVYVIHAAMAVAVLGTRWAWFIVGLAAFSYVCLFFFYRPLEPVLSERVASLGRWSAIVLVMVLIAYFIGRVMRSLRQREQELTAARERAGRHEHLAALTTLAAGAAHELGTPLSTIALVAKEMERGQDTDSLVEDARLIRHEVDRCRKILDRMRVDVIEDAGLRPSSSTLARLIEELQTDLRDGEPARLTVINSERSDLLIARSRVLRRAVGVLLRNAFDASPPDGQVTLFFQRRAGNIIFEVQDGGGGMSDEVLRRAGQPFFTTKPPGKGMGLGLFLVRLVADTYQGRFVLSSTPGQGTRSLLELPDRIDTGDADGNSEAQDVGGGRRRDLPHAAGQSTVEPRL